MIMNAGNKPNFNEEEVTFFNLLARKAKENLIVTIEDIDELKKEMGQEDIPANKLYELCKKMEHYRFLEYRSVGGQSWIELYSTEVKVSTPTWSKSPPQNVRGGLWLRKCLFTARVQIVISSVTNEKTSDSHVLIFGAMPQRPMIVHNVRS